MSSLGNRRRIKKGVDHISNLPDTVLCYILSFLTTKAAVKTSILSKRWKHVWTKVPALDFTEIVNISTDRQLSLEEKICLKDCIDKVLLHNDASYVQRFCLDVMDVDAFYVNSWLIAASRREMHEINIALNVKTLNVLCLPPRFLLSEKLTVLKLQGPISISASASFHLPNLEIIHLSKFKFPDDEFMKRLSSSCLVLRELHIVNCCVKATICVESLSLKSLIIRKTRTSQEKVSFAVKTPNLTYLVLDEFWVLVDIGEMRSLNEAEVNFFVNDFQVEELLSKVSGVKYLHLKSEALLTSRELPVFPNLIWLKCHAEKKLSKPLHCAPKLKSLIILYFNENSPFDPKFAPEHLPCLESVEICSFCGNEEELNMVAYFLKAATALKEMKIIFDCCITSDVTTVLSVCQELLDIPRSSAVCQVKISKLGL